MSDNVLSITRARSELTELVNRVHYRDEQIVLTKNGKPVAALISQRALELLNRLVEDAEDAIDAEAVREGVDEQTVSWEELKTGSR